MAFTNPAATAETLVSADPTVLRQLWDAEIKVAEQETDFFQQFEGPTEASLIETRDEPSKGAGETISFTVTNGFYKDGKHGSEYFNTASDYEKPRSKTLPLKVDWIRNGIIWDERLQSHLGVKTELEDKFPKQMGDWVGRKKNRAMWMAYREKGGSANVMVVGSGSNTINDLSSGDTLGWNAIVDAGTYLGNRGAKPAMIGKVGKNKIHRYMVMASKSALRSLKTDDQYLEALEDAGVDGKANELFTGGYSDVDGHCIVEFQDLDHGEDGPIGSTITPRLRLKDEVTAATTAFDMTGGTGDANTFYTQDFPNHNFVFNKSDVLSAGSDTFYLLVKNPHDAPTDPGKFGFYSATVNDGKKITISGRLGSAVGGIRNTTIGSVVWDTGIWSGKHTEVHPANAMVYLANAKGQPYGWTLVSGANSARRGYGKYRNTRMTDSDEGGFIKKSFVATVFGQNLVHRIDGAFPNHVMLVHAVNYVGLGLPTIA